MTQHYRMTQADAIAQYKDGLISATALIYYYLKIKLAPDWKMTLHQRSVCKELGISKAAFYKGIQRLKDKGLIDWEAPNGVVVSFVQSEDTCDQSKTVERSTDACDQSETVGQIGDSLDKSETCWTDQRLIGQIGDSLDKSETHWTDQRLIGQIGDSLDRSETRWTDQRLVGQIRDSLDRSETPLDRSETPLDRSETPTPPNPAQSKHSPDSPYSYQIFINSLSDCERESFFEFGMKKAAELPKPPVLPKKWIERNWLELSSEFKAVSSPVSSLTPNQVDPELYEQQRQELLLAASQELAELKAQQQKWKQQKAEDSTTPRY